MKSETHMSNLKLPNMSYSNLRELLKESGKSRIKLAYATEVMQEPLGLAILHHGNIIARVYPPKGTLTVDTCGWDSVTTSARLSKVLSDNGLPYRVSIRKGVTVLLTDSLAPVCNLSTATFREGLLV
jgi:hypothetical protein